MRRFLPLFLVSSFSAVLVQAQPLSITTLTIPPGTVDTPYSATLAATGGTSPYTWSATGLPAGFTIDAATGQISGAPSAAGTFTVMAQVADAAMATALQNYTLVIAIEVSGTVPNGTVGLPYNGSLTPTGGTSPYTWSATNAPPGLNVDPGTGTIAGVPLTAGNFTITVQVSDSAGATGTASFPVTIAPPLAPLDISSSSLPNGQVAIAYSATLSATGGLTPYTWSATGLPAGLNLNTQTGAVTGTPTAAGPAAVNVTVTDALNAAVTKQFPLSIATSVSITTASLPNGTVNATYTATLAASGGTTPYTWSATGLPAGLTVNPSTGAINGTPTGAGAATVNVTVTDALSGTASKPLSVTIAPALSITTTSLASGIVGTAYSAPVAATGGTAPLAWSATGLPAGLAIDAGSGAISGTPTAAGTSTVNITVTDAASATATKSLNIAIAAALTITTSSLPGGTVGLSYSATVAASGGTTPYTWSASGLPPGLSINASTGAITGTPAMAGSFAATVQVKDASNVTGSQQFNIAILGAVTITTASLPNGVAGVAYSVTVAAIGGTAPYTWSATGLPPGLNIDAASGAISGTPSAEGSFSPTVQARDANGATGNKQYTVSIVTTLAITVSTLPGGTTGTAYNATLTAAGGATPYTWSVTTGSLPPGLALNAASGAITGTPAAAGSSSFTVRVADSGGLTATSNFTIIVANPAPALSLSGTLGGGTVGVSYTGALQASGGVPPYTFSITSGSLPQGLALSATAGTILGTPNRVGASTFTIRVADTAGATTSQPFTISIGAALTISPASLPAGGIGTVYQQALTVAGGTPPYVWSIAAGALPAGLALDPGTGQIRGTPSIAGSYSFTVQVQDGNNGSGTQGYTLAINSGLTITSTSPLPPGALGAAYTQAIAAISGVAPFTWSVANGALPPGIVLDGARGVLSGTPSAVGTFNFTLSVSDATGANASKAFSLRVVNALAVSTTSLPGGTLEAPYSATLAAVAGTSPYTWAISAGELPPGLALNASTGVIAGTPAAAGAFNFTVRVTDAVSATATQALTITIAGGLTVTSGPALPGAVLGTPYTTTLAAGGGTAPFTWSITAGALPAGLALNASTGAISGTPAAGGAFNFTAQVSDAAGAKATAALTLNVSAQGVQQVQITGVPQTAGALEQPAVSITLSKPYSVGVTGQLVLTFAPDAVTPSDDPSIQFSTGGRTANFTIAANAANAVFTTPALQFQTGSVAGTITLTVKLQAGGVDITPDPAPSSSVKIARAAPVIRSAKLVSTGSGFEVWVTGYATSREITQGAVTFTPAPGANLPATSFQVNMTDSSHQWYADAGSTQYGSQFTIVQPFTVTGGTNVVSSVSVTLTNSAGTSAAATGSF